MRLPAALLLIWAATFASGPLWAGGSGLNVIVVVNQNSTNSVELGNDYCEQRGVPPQNLFRMTNWTGSTIQWSRTNFETLLLNPLLAMIAARGLTNQAEFVLLSMDIPYQIWDNDAFASTNSTTSALFYGFKDWPESSSTCSLGDASSNSYAYSELSFPEAPPDTAPTNSFLAMMLTDSNLAGADLILSRGVASDSTFPTQSVYLAKTSDTARNVRYTEFDNAIFEARVRGDNSLVYTNTDSTSSTNLLGLLTGLANLSLPANAFVPGAIGDSLTSYGGYIFNPNGQTTLLAFLEAGAAGSYGTVVEPCNYTQKFPDPLDYFYQDRGFCLAEAYYQSLLNPYEGLLAGEPLSAPFARPGTADWSSLTNGAILSGQASLNLTFTAAATNLPLGRVDLFLDGTFSQTISNLPPSAGNVVSVTLNSTLINYTVPANATVASVVTNLAAALNAKSGTTHVEANATGDRIGLQSTTESVPGGNVTLSASASKGTAALSTTLLSPARSTFLDTVAFGYHGLLASNTPIVGDWLQLAFILTNNTHVTVAVTNTAPGTNIETLVTSLLNTVNTNSSLVSADGALAADFLDLAPDGLVAAEFNLYARSPGWPASEIQAKFTSSPNLLALPSGNYYLEDNLADLEPRNDLYVSSGLTSLPVSFVLDTTRLSDGFHQLTAVAYEGTSIRTQTRISRTVQVMNTTLSATFTPLLVGTNATLDVPLQFSVSANAGNIASIQLFSTGGSVGVVSNQSSALFTVPSTTLGLGLHPFYAVVTDTGGKQYQTQTDWIRLIPSFALSLSSAPLMLSWPSIPGQGYHVLATTNLAAAFQTVTSLVASNTIVQWPIPAPAGAASFYRVSLSP